MAFNSSMPMFWGDYLRDTGHLSPAEHGAYLLLIAHQWTTAKTLPDDDAALGRIARMSPREWRAARRAIEEFFTVENGTWSQKRVAMELTRAREAFEKRSNAGSKGGSTTQAKRKQWSSNASSDDGNNDQAYSNSKPIPNSNPKEFIDSNSMNGSLALRSETIEEARKIAPRYDVYEIERLWKNNTTKTGMVLRNPAAAFLSFVKKHVEANPL